MAVSSCQEPIIGRLDGEDDLYVCTRPRGHTGPHVDEDAEWAWRNLMDVERLIKGHEGLALRTYRDTEGNSTIGWGHLCDAGQPDTVITEAQAEELFRGDFEAARRIADEWLGDAELDDPRYAVIVDMAFNLGRKLKQFKALRTALHAGDWDGAASAMLRSKWARQTGYRALENAAIMGSGKWIPSDG